jgi:hypothetical protein
MSESATTNETVSNSEPSVESYERQILRLKTRVNEMEKGLKILHDWYGADHEDSITISRTEMGYLLGVHPWPEGWKPRNFD